MWFMLFCNIQFPVLNQQHKFVNSSSNNDMTISHSHFSFLQDIITNLSSQINILQSQNVTLIQTLQTLQTKITEANLPKIASKLKSITNKLSSKTSHKRNRFDSNTNLITSYFQCPSSQIVNQTSAAIPQHIQQQKNHFTVRSLTANP